MTTDTATPATATATPATATAPSRRLLSPFILPGLLGLVVVFFSLWSQTSNSFASSNNVASIVSSNSVLAVAAIALLFPLIAGQFDLSVGANIGLCAVVVAALFREGAPIPVAVAGGVLAGVLVGLANGALVAYVGVSSFIITLGMSTVISGLVLAYTDGVAIIEGIPSEITALSSDRFLGVPKVAFVVLAIAALVGYVLRFTPFGRSIRAVGSNAAAARLVGFNVRRLTLVSFVAAGAMCGLGGALVVSSTGSANTQVGPGYLLPAFAAVFLGATVSKTSAFNVVGTIIAVLFVKCTLSGLILAGWESWVEQLFQGSVLILAVTVATLARRRTEGTLV